MTDPAILRRFRIEATAELVGAVERQAHREAGVPIGRGGAVVVMHPASADLSMNLHLHLLVLDGVYLPSTPGGDPRFRPLGGEVPTASIRAVVRRLRIRLETLMPPGSAKLLAIAPAGPQPQRSRAPGSTARAPEVRGEHVSAFGLALHRSPSIPSDDRSSRVRLAAYLTRPLLHPAAVERPDGRTVRLRLGRPTADHASHLEFSAAEFERRISALAHAGVSRSVTYHGVLAGRSAARVATPPGPGASQLELSGMPRKLPPATTRTRAACRACGGPMRVIAVEPSG